MIKFFRKIRQKLLSENKFSKYLIYAIGEIVLVVIGILIALQLNTWKQEADDKAIANTYLDGIYTDLNQDLERIQFLQAFYKSKTDGMQRLIQYASAESVPVNDTLGKLFVQSLAYRKYASKKSNYTSVISAGYLNKIRDKQLVNEIITYYETPYLSWSTEIYAKLIEAIDYNQSDVIDSRDLLVEIGNMRSIPDWSLSQTQYITDYSQLIRTPWATHILSSNIRQANMIFYNLERFTGMNNALKASIKSYQGRP